MSGASINFNITYESDPTSVINIYNIFIADFIYSTVNTKSPQLFILTFVAGNNNYCLILFTAPFSSRETCACEIPISSATSVCVLPSIKRL